MNIIFTVLTVLLLNTVLYADEAVVAKVNGKLLFSRDVEAAAQDLVKRTTYHGGVSQEKLLELQEKALEIVVDEELQYQDAVAQGLKPDRKAVKAQMERIRLGFKSRKEFRQALENDGLTEKNLQATVEKKLLVKSVFEKTVTGPSLANEEEIEDYYEKHMNKFKQPEAVRLRIFSSRDESKAKEALDYLIDGEDFSDLAARMSEDRFRLKGGDIGYLSRGSILPELEEEAFKLKIGGTSGIIKADGQYFIIKVESKRPEQMLSLEESRNLIKKEVEKQRSTELLDAWISRLRTNAKIEYILQPAGIADPAGL